MARKILLADDSVTAQNMGRKILADAGYEVITVNNGSAALKKISEQKPDVIVLDVYMPGYSGLEVCQRLKEAQDTARIPVLLTVGKLEPFKPEEAKRVRAEGYIVKPFEASELLSALTKLEDKIVPRSEPKQGRFARAIAAVEESGAPENAEEDTSWKSRISFPKKKKKKAEEDEEENAEDAAIVAGKKSKSVEAVALPAGLPRDVTPEEIAAIAAAAAHVQAVVDSAKESPAETETKPAAPIAVEPQIARPVAEEPAAEVKEAKAEEKIESKNEASKAEVSELPVAPGVEASASADASDIPATFATANVEEKSEVAAVPEPAVQKEPEPVEPPSHADVIAAIAALEPANGNSWSNDHKTQAVNEPATTPALVAANKTDGIRWTAVPAQLDATETAISLEAEMQKAYAAFAAAEANQPGFVTLAPEPEAPRAQDSMSVQAAVVEAASKYPNSEPELAQAVSAVAGVTTEAVAAAAAELAAVAASLAKSKASEETGVLPAVPAAAEPVVETAVPTSAHQAPEAQPSVAVPAEPVAETPVQAEAVTETPQPVVAIEQLVQEVPPVQEEKTVEQPAAMENPVVAKAEEAAQAGAPEAISEPQPVAPAAEVAVNPPARSNLDSPANGNHNESDLHATTAAAWASWRQIRETDGRSEPSDAAMAVAAGAEKSPTETSPDPNDPAIANLVESVLADLRPKIVAEISRKLGEKK